MCGRKADREAALAIPPASPPLPIVGTARRSMPHCHIAFSWVAGFGGKLGDALIERHGMQRIGQLLALSQQQLVLIQPCPRVLRHAPHLSTWVGGVVAAQCFFDGPSLWCWCFVFWTFLQAELVGERSALWIYQRLRGLDKDRVKPRLAPKSLGCGKTFRGPTALTAFSRVLHFLRQLAGEASLPPAVLL